MKRFTKEFLTLLPDKTWVLGKKSLGDIFNTGEPENTDIDIFNRNLIALGNEYRVEA